MSLIRSEHVNEQATHQARDDLAAAEKALDDSRTALERQERRQYHEERVWSDTIRRNSTWVTFGLMGLNIVLLLANLVVVEPWRRKRLVKEFRSAMDEKTIATPSLGKAFVESGTAGPTPDGRPLVDETAAMMTCHDDEARLPREETDLTTVHHDQSWRGMWAQIAASAKNLFSEHQVILRQVDLTTLALSSAASGIVATGAVLLLVLRPK